MLDSPSASFGLYLREAREGCGLTLRQISVSTKISMTVLRALEMGRTNDIPGGIFVRTFVKSYAREVGLDPDEAIERLLSVCGEPRLKLQAHAIGLRSRPSLETVASAKRVTMWLTAGGVPIAVLFVAFALRLGGTPDADVSVLANATLREDAAGSAFTSDTSAPERRAGLPFGRAAPVDGLLTIAIHPTGPCWVSLTVDGDRVFSRVLRTGEREVHAAEEEVVIIVGDTATFAFSINEQPGQLPRGAGQVATVTINRDNYRRYVIP